MKTILTAFFVAASFTCFAQDGVSRSPTLERREYFVPTSPPRIVPIYPSQPIYVVPIYIPPVYTNPPNCKCPPEQPIKLYSR